jgi:hypothetical protein
MALRLRRGTEIERLLITPQQGEIIYVTDTKKIYVGDGATIGGVLVGPTLLEQLTPQLGGNLDLNGRNIVGTGNINITGNITATGTINLGDGAEDNINVGGLINSPLTPAIDDSYNLGTSAKQWRNVWATQVNVDTTLAVGSQIIKLSGGSSDSSLVLWDAESDTLSASSVIATTIEGNLTGSVFSDDSVALVDGVAGLVVGNVSNTTVTTNAISSKTLSLFPDDVDGLSGLNIVTTGNDNIDYDLFGIFCFHDSAIYGNSSKFLRARGTPSTPETVLAGDIIHQYSFNSATGAETLIESVKISTLVDPNGTVSVTKAPGKFVVSTQNNSGTLTEGLTIDMNSVVGLNANQALTVGGGSGQVDTSSVVSYVKLKVGTTEYAVPLYAINP